jgi:hypothetical protein
MEIRSRGWTIEKEAVVRNLLMVSVAVLLLGLAAGCGKPQPLLAGGKPVAHWVEALRSPDAKLRKQAATKLGNVGPSDPAALPALTAALKDPDPAVRCEVILALAKFGPAASDSTALLIEAQKDQHPKVRAYAARALEKIQASP